MVSATLAYGGLAKKTITVPGTEAVLLSGRPWGRELFDRAAKALKSEIDIAPNAPGGMHVFRKALAASFLLKFFIHVGNALEGDVDNP